MKAGHETAFERSYGPHGDWAEFFSHGDGYLRTELLHDAVGGRRYLTIDYWNSKDAYDSFRQERMADYEELDRQCAAMTESETRIGSFTRKEGET